MPILYYVQNSFVSLFLISILLFYVIGQGGRRQAQDSLYVALLLSTFAIILFELAVDLLSGRVFYGSRTLLTVVTTIFYMLNPIPGALYLLYLDQLRRRWVKIPRGIGLAVLTPVVGSFILVVISLFNGIIFTIDSNNVYMRGPWFFLIILFSIICMVLGFVYLFIYRVSFRKRDFSLFMFFPLPILVGSILQIKFYGMEIAGTSLAITLLIVYLHMQNSQANKDYLTKLYNRSLGEQYLQNLINHQKKTQAIGGILMDINRFKQVNDTYGHDLGDKTLRQFSHLLLDSFGSSWIIARYGGDEFLLFKEGITGQELQGDLDHFTKQLDRFNARASLPFSLSVSIGCSLYSATGATDAPSFIKALDVRMYEHKRACHAQEIENPTQ